MKKIIAIFLFLFLFLYAKTQIHTYETWSEVEVSTDLFDNGSVDFAVDLRIFNELLEIKSFSNEIGYTYRFNRMFRTGISHKITFKNEKQGYFADHKTSIDIQYRNRINHFRFAYRNKMEFSRSVYTSDVSDTFYEYENRNRIRVQYRRGRLDWEPSISIETFHPIEQKNVYHISEVRFGGNISFDLGNDYSFDCGYTYRKYLQKSIPESTSIFSFALSKDF